MRDRMRYGMVLAIFGKGTVKAAERGRRKLHQVDPAELVTIKNAIDALADLLREAPLDFARAKTLMDGLDEKTRCRAVLWILEPEFIERTFKWGFAHCSDVTPEMQKEIMK